MKCPLVYKNCIKSRLSKKNLGGCCFYRFFRGCVYKKDSSKQEIVDVPINAYIRVTNLLYTEVIPTIKLKDTKGKKVDITMLSNNDKHQIINTLKRQLL
jgi:hypothetical protein